jgi:hypothetical protein
MAFIRGVIALFTGALILPITAYLGGQIIPPLYEVVVADSAVQAMGYDRGAEVAVRIGLQYVLPFMGISLFVWFLFLRLQLDSFQGVRGRGR